MALLIMSCGDSSGSGNAEDAVDQRNPEMVLQAIFEVANGKGPAVLGNLCDPLKENDLDTQRICDMAEKPAPDEEFVHYFKDAKITGAATIDGDSAWVPFEFGPSPARADQMQFIRRNGNWHLFSF